MPPQGLAGCHQSILSLKHMPGQRPRKPSNCQVGSAASSSSNSLTLEVLGTRAQPKSPTKSAHQASQPRVGARPPILRVLTRWKASWECWKVRRMYLRTHKAAPRTMGYSSFEKTWKTVSGQEPLSPRSHKAKFNHRPKRQSKNSNPMLTAGTQVLTDPYEGTGGKMDG